MFSHIRFIPAALTAAALLAVSASAMAVSSYEAPNSDYSMRDAQPTEKHFGDLSERRDINPAWTFTIDERNQRTP